MNPLEWEMMLAENVPPIGGVNPQPPPQLPGTSAYPPGSWQNIFFKPLIPGGPPRNPGYFSGQPGSGGDFFQSVFGISGPEFLLGIAAAGGILIGLWMMAGSPKPQVIPIPA